MREISKAHEKQEWHLDDEKCRKLRKCLSTNICSWFHHEILFIRIEMKANSTFGFALEYKINKHFFSFSPGRKREKNVCLFFISFIEKAFLQSQNIIIGRMQHINLKIWWIFNVWYHYRFRILHFFYEGIQSQALSNVKYKQVILKSCFPCHYLIYVFIYPDSKLSHSES